MKKYLLIPLLITTVLTITACQPKQDNTVPNTSEEQVQEQANNQEPTTNSYQYTATESGQTAFDLLQANEQVDYTEYDFGTFIEGINGQKGDETHFWAFYVNGEKANAGADSTILDEGDTIEFKWEEIE